MNLLDIAGLAFTAAMVVQFLKDFVQLAIKRLDPGMQNAVIRLFVYLVSYGVVLASLAQTDALSVTPKGFIDILGPAFSVFLAAITGYHVLTGWGNAPQDAAPNLVPIVLPNQVNEVPQKHADGLALAPANAGLTEPPATP